jgi:hypothetical protein
MNNKELNKYAKLSLVSIMLAGIFASIHNYYEMGSHALILMSLIVILPIILIFWFKYTKSKVALSIYGLISVWIVIGFGLVDGLFKHTLKILSGYGLVFLKNLHGGNIPLPQFNIIFEGTALLTFIASIFVAYYSYKFIKKEVKNA